MADTSNIVALDQISAMLVKGITISTVLVNESDISRAIDQYYGFELSIDGILHEIETGEVNYQSMASPSDEYSQPMVRLIDALLADAVQNGASDIHFEPEQSFLRIRYRIDGILRQIRSLHKSYWPAMAVRLKVMSNMNIAETRAPQDGRISITFFGPADRFPRLGAADHAWRKLRAARAGPAKRHRPARCAGPGRARAEPAETDDRAPRWHDPGDRPDRQRQDHHACIRSSTISIRKASTS